MLDFFFKGVSNAGDYQRIPSNTVSHQPMSLVNFPPGPAQSDSRISPVKDSNCKYMQVLIALCSKCLSLSLSFSLSLSLSFSLFLSLSLSLALFCYPAPLTVCRTSTKASNFGKTDRTEKHCSWDDTGLPAEVANTEATLVVYV